MNTKETAQHTPESEKVWSDTQIRAAIQATWTHQEIRLTCDPHLCKDSDEFRDALLRSLVDHPSAPRLKAENEEMLAMLKKVREGGLSFEEKRSINIKIDQFIQKADKKG